MHDVEILIYFYLIKVEIFASFFRFKDEDFIESSKSGAWGSLIQRARERENSGRGGPWWRVAPAVSCLASIGGPGYSSIFFG